MIMIIINDYATHSSFMILRHQYSSSVILYSTILGKQFSFLNNLWSFKFTHLQCAITLGWNDLKELYFIFYLPQHLHSSAMLFPNSPDCLFILPDQCHAQGCSYGYPDIKYSPPPPPHPPWTAIPAKRAAWWVSPNSLNSFSLTPPADPQH